jgi:hypothetical protein
MEYNNDDKSVSNLSVINSATGTLTIQGTGGVQMPTGTASQRPTLTNGLIRVNSDSGYVEVVSGSQWINIIDAVNKAGDTMTGSLSLPRTIGKGLLIENSYSWIDIIGDVTPKVLGTESAILAPYIGKNSSWAHAVGSYGNILYHMPHQYAPGTDLHIHVHWGHNGTDISGAFKVNLWVTYATREGIYQTPIATSVIETGLTIANIPQYHHRVSEILLSTPIGSSSLLNTNLLEVDGLISVHYELDTIPSITGSSYVNLPYIHTIDIHMQSTNVGTHNKDPNFYS